ncbi:hypothetical protein [Sphingomonas sp.]|uniref:hypothetical protein n=1 Tax=Sphingomonas sp. TaxID=28214 RepID=UPI0025F75850|nr:hypothetical protein [Sphingomonas sp.]
MTQDFEAEYYRKREAAERDLAASASDAGISRIHLQMADMYADKAEQAAPPRLAAVAPH